MDFTALDNIVEECIRIKQENQELKKENELLKQRFDDIFNKMGELINDNNKDNVEEVFAGTPPGFFHKPPPPDALFENEEDGDTSSNDTDNNNEEEHTSRTLPPTIEQKLNFKKFLTKHYRWIPEHEVVLHTMAPVFSRDVSREYREWARLNNFILQGTNRQIMNTYQIIKYLRNKSNNKYTFRTGSYHNGPSDNPYFDLKHI